ncbi:tRNA 2'-phosphotransferase 1-like [Littorina saxatilis]
MKRTHVHFAAGEPGETGVISGMRGSCDLMIYLDLEKALADGLKFFRSANNVILTEGNQDGAVPPDFFMKVINRKTGKEISIDRELGSLGGPTDGTDLPLPESGASSVSVTADDLADEMDSKRKQRRKKKNPQN